MEELSLFNFSQMKINKPIRLIEFFGGIGSQAMALRDIGADFEHYKLVEVDKYAVQSYNAIHDTQFTPLDIREVHAGNLEVKDKDKFCYIVTYSFPCTDLSVAGKMKGMSKADWENGNSTRSGLLWEVERILKECTKDELPQILLMENVPQVHAERNMADFESWLSFLRSKGYHNHWQDFNAKNYGIPQSRNRCFCVSILSDEFVDFEFPDPIPLTTVMKDYLEEEVDEKYYINTDKANKLIKQFITNNVIDGLKDRITIDLTIKDPQEISVANCIVSHIYKNGIYKRGKEGNGVIKITKARILGKMKGKYESSNRVYDKEALCPTLNTCQGSGQKPKIINKCIVAMRGRNPEKPTSRKAGLPTDQKLEKAPEGIEKSNVVPTLTASSSENINYVEIQYRLRKLTPKECWRLMGYTDKDFEKAQKAGVSNSQLYKQAGNAIVKQVLMSIQILKGV